MKRQLQGLSLILFAVVLMLFAMIVPPVPYFSGTLDDIALWAGLASAIAGVVICFKKEK